ncbi:alpha/beta hydrolase [Planomonospora sp. ID67723]|uniref:alpha/beta hydrolase n=1 Tax=Planomonospora sp. ID67723 TaxID=2738134 RepID=UPI001A257636|nr:alpha/beta hydrolase [Planomonospora sp. ID67723]MBG0832678.1 alpha/beta hydrolase [Planomonospora sp. ID67723]
MTAVPDRRRAPGYRREDVPVRGGDLRVGVWGDRGPLVVAAHGITSSHMAWTLVGPELGRDHRFVAVDLRGRGGSRDLPAPYGMAVHADDLAAVIRRYGGGPAVLAGHSMGGFVVAETARRHPRLVDRVVLADGGAPLPLPVGAHDVPQAIERTVGPVLARLRRTFGTRAEYHDLWRAHPAFADWTEACAAYADYDLVEAAGGFAAACRLEAALADAPEVYALPGVRPRSLPVPAVFLRAARGMLDEPHAPLYSPGRAAEWLPGAAESTVDGVNHYTITLGARGSSAVAGAVRDAGPHPGRPPGAAPSGGHGTGITSGNRSPSRSAAGPPGTPRRTASGEPPRPGRTP